MHVSKQQKIVQNCTKPTTTNNINELEGTQFMIFYHGFKKYIKKAEAVNIGTQVYICEYVL